MGAMLADTPPSQPSPIFMGEGGTKGDHRVITRISSKQSEAVPQRRQRFGGPFHHKTPALARASRHLCSENLMDTGVWFSCGGLVQLATLAL